MTEPETPAGSCCHHEPATPTATPRRGAGPYTCPMHPEVVQDGPGTCPKCGMALEPTGVPDDDADDPELVDMRRRLVVSLPFTAAVFALAMGEMLPGRPLDRVVPPAASPWAQLVLSLPVVLWAGAPFFVRGARSIANRSPNMFTLIALGTGAAWLTSVAAVVAPGLFPASFLDAEGRAP
ncbi:MAG: heavy metal-binding domain-containing protein, partial [Planctomycetota bacterium JB042]